MRFGLFIALLVPLIVIVGLSVPIPYGSLPLPPGIAELPTRAQCLLLETDQPTLSDWTALLRVQLLAQPTRGEFSTGPAYRAVIWPDSSFYIGPNWQPAGRDSIDIAWHHSPLLRIPAQGRIRMGRVTPRGYSSFYHALLAPDRVVRVEELPCPPDIDVERRNEVSSLVERPHN